MNPTTIINHQLGNQLSRDSLLSHLLKILVMGYAFSNEQEGEKKSNLLKQPSKKYINFLKRDDEGNPVMVHCMKSRQLREQYLQLGMLSRSYISVDNKAPENGSSVLKNKGKKKIPNQNFQCARQSIKKHNFKRDLRL